jgi:hypothetical protein
MRQPRSGIPVPSRRLSLGAGRRESLCGSGLLPRRESGIGLARRQSGIGLPAPLSGSSSSRRASMSGTTALQPRSGTNASHNTTVPAATGKVATQPPAKAPARSAAAAAAPAGGAGTASRGQRRPTSARGRKPSIKPAFDPTEHARLKKQKMKDASRLKNERIVAAKRRQEEREAKKAAEEAARQERLANYTSQSATGTRRVAGGEGGPARPKPVRSAIGSSMANRGQRQQPPRRIIGDPFGAPESQTVVPSPHQAPRPPSTAAAAAAAEADGAPVSASVAFAARTGSGGSAIDDEDGGSLGGRIPDMRVQQERAKRQKEAQIAAPDCLRAVGCQCKDCQSVSLSPFMKKKTAQDVAEAGATATATASQLCTRSSNCQCADCASEAAAPPVAKALAEELGQAVEQSVPYSRAPTGASLLCIPVSSPRRCKISQQGSRRRGPRWWVPAQLELPMH